MSSEPRVDILPAQPKLMTGAGWPEHEGLIVGNEQGLRNLMAACQQALESGECISSKLDDFSGVRRLPEGWFEESRQQASSVPTLVLLVFVIALVVIGFGTIVRSLI